MSDTKPELKKITQEELNQKLREHELWVKDKNQGKQADLSQYDLKKLSFLPDSNLTYINLSGLDLTGAEFAWTDLTRATLTGATLVGANFSGATLVGTKFLNATMHRADLRETKTAGMQLGGADVTNAKLPDEIKSFDGLKTVEEASKIAKRLFTMLLTALGFSALTILSTKDHLLLTNAITSPLPLIQTPMPLAGFYRIAPFLLTVFFIYFLLNLLHLYKLISRLPAVFPDGTPLDEKIFPWLLNTLVREFFPRLPEKEVSLFWARKLFIVFLAWWTTPIILFFFWFRYLSRHDHFGSDWHIICLAFVIFSVGLTYSKTLRMFNRVSEFTLHLIFIVLATLYLPFFVGKNFFSPTYDSYLKLDGRPITWGSFTNDSYLKLDSPIKWISFTNEDDYYWQHFADFTEQDVSHKPDNWSSEKPAEGVKGAMLEHANLDYAYAHSAFLVKAKLTGASFKHADLSRADLSGADLNYADARSAFLVRAKLTGTSLKHATLSKANLGRAMLDGKADFTNAHLDGANLILANLTEAILSGVDFTRADLTDADLSGADLTGADLTGAELSYAKFDVLDINVDHKKLIKKTTKITPTQIKSAKNWQLAIYDKDFAKDELELTDQQVSETLFAYLKEQNLGSHYEEQMRKYRVHYGWPTGEKTK